MIPLLKARNLSFVATTRDGHDVAGSSTLSWKFDPSAPASQFDPLPYAKTVLTTFPLTGTGQSKTLVTDYISSHGKKASRFIQFGSTGIWQIPQRTLWVSRTSPYDKTNARAIAEDELLGLGGCVLNLAGLWGGSRDPKTWVSRVATTKEGVKGKTSLHMINGVDVARAVLAVVGDWDKAHSKRWMITDGFVYDWWSLFAGWADANGSEDEGGDSEPTEQARWVYELMQEEGVYALPRSMNALQRCYFGREFWDTFGLAPLKARI